MTIEYVLTYITPAAFAVLPAAMASPEATAMLLAIIGQESNFEHRKQVGGGPARGLLQFERGGGIRGVMTHPKTRVPLNDALRALSFQAEIGRSIELHEVVGFNDTVACVFARLLLYTLPAPLPVCGEHDESFRQYLAAWNPGAWTRGTPAERRALRERWDGNFTRAWAAVAA